MWPGFGKLIISSFCSVVCHWHSDLLSAWLELEVPPSTSVSFTYCMLPLPMHPLHPLISATSDITVKALHDKLSCSQGHT